MSVRVEGLHFAYGSNAVLDGIDFEVTDGTLVNVLGPNGTGKSTLFRCMLGLSDRYEGRILVNGQDVRKLSIRERAREMAYIPQSHKPVYAYRVIDIVLMGANAESGAFANPGRKAAARAYEALERIGIEWLAERSYTQISGGEQQLVLIARALAQQATTLVMDEPTSALDYGNTVRVLSCIRRLAEEGFTIIQSTHQPDQAFLYSDKALVINKGRIVSFAAPQDAITKEVIERIYGVEVEVSSLYDDRVRVCVPVQEINRPLRRSRSATGASFDGRMPALAADGLKNPVERTTVGRNDGSIAP